MSISRGHRPFDCTDQYNPQSMFTDADASRDASAHARDPRVRGAGARRCTATARCRASCTCRSGRRRRPSVRCWPLRARGRDHVDPSRPRPLPRQGPRPARDVRRADGQGPRDEPRSRRLDAHRRPGARDLGANGIVDAGLADRGGAATRRRSSADDGTVAVAFFGDGAVAHGTFHEAVNLAAVWQLPVIFFCENNGYAEFSPAPPQHAATLERAPLATASTTSPVDGNDVVATAAAMGDVVEAARAGRSGRRRGRHLPLARSLRRRSAALPVARAKCASGKRAIHCVRRRVAAPLAGITRRPGRSQLESEVRRQSSTARSSGAATDRPARRDAHALRRARRGRARRAAARQRPTHRCSARWTRSALRSKPSSRADEQRVRRRDRRRRRRQRVRPDARLHDRFGDRVRDTPISETRSWASASARRWRACSPVVELMYLDFLGVCLDQLLNQAAKLPFMTGGAAQMALTVRTQFGAGRSSGSQHSQSLEALLAHIPGLTVVMPSTPADTYGLLRAAIQDPNPVVFIENRLLYGMKGPQPPADHIVPIGIVGRRARRDRRHRRVGLADGARGGRRGRAARRRRHLRRGDRPANGRSARHRSDPRLGAQDEPAADRARGRRPVRHRRRDRAPPSRATASGISARRSSGSALHRRRRPTRPSSNGRGCPTATTSRDAIRRLATAWPRISSRGRAITTCWISLVPSPISSTFASQ